MSDGPPSDREVIRRCQAGEVEPFSVLVQRYQDRVYNLAYRLLENHDDALDAAQETFVRVYAALDRFDNEWPLAPWLFRIVKNACLGMLRHRRPSLISLDALDTDSVDALLEATSRRNSAAGQPEQLLQQEFREEQIRACVLLLPLPYRTVVLLRYQEDLTYEEIAESMELPLGTVKTLLYRARQRLRRTLAEECLE